MLSTAQTNFSPSQLKDAIAAEIYRLEMDFRVWCVKEELHKKHLELEQLQSKLEQQQPELEEEQLEAQKKQLELKQQQLANLKKQFELKQRQLQKDIAEILKFGAYAALDLITLKEAQEKYKKSEHVEQIEDRIRLNSELLGTHRKAIANKLAHKLYELSTKPELLTELGLKPAPARGQPEQQTRRLLANSDDEVLFRHPRKATQEPDFNDEPHIAQQAANPAEPLKIPPYNIGLHPLFLDRKNRDKTAKIYDYFDPYYITYSDNTNNWGRDEYLREVNRHARDYSEGKISKVQALGNIYSWCFKQYYRKALSWKDEFKGAKLAMGEILKAFEARIAREAQQDNSDAQKLFGYIMMKRISQNQKLAKDKSTNILHEYFLDGMLVDVPVAANAGIPAPVAPAQETNFVIFKNKVTKQKVKHYENNENEYKKRNANWANELALAVRKAAIAAQEANANAAFNAAVQKAKQPLNSTAYQAVAKNAEKVKKILEDNEIERPHTKKDGVVRTADALAKIELVHAALTLERPDDQAIAKAQTLIAAFENYQPRVNRDVAKITQDMLLNEEEITRLEALAKKADRLLDINEHSLKKMKNIPKEKQALVLRAIRAFTLISLAQSAALKVNSKCNFSKSLEAANSRTIQLLVNQLQPDANANQLNWKLINENFVQDFENKAAKLSQQASEVTKECYDDVKNYQKRSTNRHAPNLWPFLADRSKRTEDPAKFHETLNCYFVESEYANFDASEKYYEDFTAMHKSIVEEHEGIVRNAAIFQVDEANNEKRNKIDKARIGKLSHYTKKLHEIHGILEEVNPEIFNQNQAKSDLLIQKILDEFRVYFDQVAAGKHGDERARQIQRAKQIRFFQHENHEDRAPKMDINQLAIMLEQLERALSSEDSELINGERISKRWRTAKNSKLYDLTYSAIEKIKGIQEKGNQPLANNAANPILALYNRARDNKKVLNKNWLQVVLERFQGMTKDLKLNVIEIEIPRARP